MFCSRCGTWASDEATLCPLCGVALQVDNGPRTGAVAPTSIATPVVPLVTYGGFWRRFGAVVIDSLVLFFPSAIVRVLLGLAPLSMFDTESPASWMAGSFELALGWFYAALLIRSSARATLGLQLLDLQVTDLHGERVTFARATWRYWAQLLSVCTFGLGYLLMLVTPRRQTLHDLVSSTVVVRVRHLAHPPLTPVLRMTP